MCGIAGVINYRNYEVEKLKRSLLHRGPDEQTIYYYDQLALVHTRLSIQDISRGKQPMHYGQYTIIFNGEIYNHLELRRYLPEFHFQTNSDTETLLYLYAKFKDKMFDLLDGMYAFAILEKDNNTLFIARDRSGKKPIYYFCDGKEFIFASELNALKTIKNFNINESAISSFLRNGFFYGPLTPYKDVQEVLAGNYITVDLNSLSISQNSYFDIAQYYKKPKQKLLLQEATNEVETLLMNSVNNRLVSSDLGIGAFLSGGIDSNLIVAIASQLKPNIKTFTVKFSDGLDESSYAKLTADRYGTNHTEIDINITSNLNEDIENILVNYGEPFSDSSAIPSYYVSKAARQHVKVILNGDGADELFGGYRRYVPFANNWLNYCKYFSWLKGYIPASKKRTIGDFLTRLLNMSAKSGLNLYLSATTDIFEDLYHFPDNVVLSSQHNHILEVMNDKDLSNLSKIMYLDFTNILNGSLLVKMDVATMANSLEGRSPFLSKYFLEFAPTLPDSFKVKGFVTKLILRNLAKKYLDNPLVTLPKRGFEIPLQKIVDSTLRDKISDYLLGDCYVIKYIDANFIKNLLQQKASISDARRVNILWILFCLEVWYQNDKKTFACG